VAEEKKQQKKQKKKKKKKMVEARINDKASYKAEFPPTATPPLLITNNRSNTENY